MDRACTPAREAGRRTFRVRISLRSPTPERHVGNRSRGHLDENRSRERSATRETLRMNTDRRRAVSIVSPPELRASRVGEWQRNPPTDGHLPAVNRPVVSNACRIIRPDASGVCIRGQPVVTCFQSVGVVAVIGVVCSVRCSVKVPRPFKVLGMQECAGTTNACTAHTANGKQTRCPHRNTDMVRQARRWAAGLVCDITGHDYTKE